MALIMFICGLYSGNYTNNTVEKCYAATKKNTTNKVSQLYNKLDPVAKGYFDIIINEDKSLYKYHKKYHKKYVKSETSMKKSALYDVVSELKELNSDLIALDIPTSARYAFLAAASGMSVGVADGPLPIADIIGAFVAIGAIGILAMEWPEIEKKWPEIEKAFEKCFSNISTDISKAFSKLKVKVQDKYYSLQFQNFSKHYAKHAKEFKDMKGGTGKKPSKKEYYNMAKSFLNKKSNDIIEGKDVENFDRMVKFNKKTLEYLVYEKSSKRIISYFLPKWTAYNNGTISSKKEWIKEALEYTLRHISRK